jgi:hypothetical protein
VSGGNRRQPAATALGNARQRIASHYSAYAEWLAGSEIMMIATTENRPDGHTRSGRHMDA